MCRVVNLGWAGLGWAELVFFSFFQVTLSSESGFCWLDQAEEMKSPRFVKKTNKQINKGRKGRISKQTKEGRKGRTNKQTNKQASKQRKGRINERMDKQRKGRTNKQTNKGRDGQTNKQRKGRNITLLDWWIIFQGLQVCTCCCTTKSKTWHGTT